MPKQRLDTWVRQTLVVEYDELFRNFTAQQVQLSATSALNADLRGQLSEQATMIEIQDEEIRSIRTFNADYVNEMETTIQRQGEEISSRQAEAPNEIIPELLDRQENLIEECKMLENINTTLKARVESLQNMGYNAYDPPAFNAPDGKECNKRCERMWAQVENIRKKLCRLAHAVETQAGNVETVARDVMRGVLRSSQDMEGEKREENYGNGDEIGDENGYEIGDEIGDEDGADHDCV